MLAPGDGGELTCSRSPWRGAVAGALAAGLVMAGPAPTWCRAEEADSSAKKEPFRYDAGGRRDPFVALVRDGQLLGHTSAAPLLGDAKPVLYGILWDAGGQSMALLNDQEVKVGDTVAGYLVSDIRRDAVVLTAEGVEPVVLQIVFDEPPQSKPSSHNTKGGDGR